MRKSQVSINHDWKTLVYILEFEETISGLCTLNTWFDGAFLLNSISEWLDTHFKVQWSGLRLGSKKFFVFVLMFFTLNIKDAINAASLIFVQQWVVIINHFNSNKLWQITAPGNFAIKLCVKMILLNLKYPSVAMLPQPGQVSKFVQFLTLDSYVQNYVTKIDTSTCQSGK